LLWISYQMSGAQLCLHQLIVPCCCFSIDHLQEWRSIVGIAGGWHCFHYYGGAKVPAHTITSVAVGLSFYCCEFHTKQVEPSFVFVSWLSHAVQHQQFAAGVQSIVGITGGWHCFHDYSGGKAFTHYHIFGSWPFF
jgi:hypothetical protein